MATLEICDVSPFRVDHLEIEELKIEGRDVMDEHCTTADAVQARATNLLQYLAALVELRAKMVRDCRAEAEKSIWQMTRGEFHRSRVSQALTGPTENSRLYWQEIERALAENKHLPPHVFREYQEFRNFCESAFRNSSSAEELSAYAAYLEDMQEVGIEPRSLAAWLRFRRAVQDRDS